MHIVIFYEFKLNDKAWFEGQVFSKSSTQFVTPWIQSKDGN